jgi:peptidyl-prolyl cis-trans isomerase D
MPFAIFRRHQRKLLAIFAILAMAAFVLSDTLVRISTGNWSRNADPVVVELYNKKYRGADINNMKVERQNANLFMFELTRVLGQPMPNFFGDHSVRAIVDAIILQHEAEKLKMPADHEVAKDWLRRITGGSMDRALFEIILSHLNNRVSGDQILSDLANQIRITRVRSILGSPLVTPLDVYNTYRAQNERVSARVVGFPVADFVKEVKDPSDAEVRAYYEKYKDVLPDADRDTPGFKIPRKIRVEILSIDGTALERGIQDKLTDAELRTYYENHKADYRAFSEFPDDIFANDPKGLLTPPLIRPFDEVRQAIALSLAAEKAHADISERFTRIKDEVIDPFTDVYGSAQEKLTDAKRQNQTANVKLPTPDDSLKAAAKKEGLEYQVTPLITREEAENYGLIGQAQVGLNRQSGGRRFAAEMFDTKPNLYEANEFTNEIGYRFLVRKIEDDAPRVPPLDEVRAAVIDAWKTEQARPLAEKAAQALAEAVKKEGGTIKGDSVQGHPVITTDLLPQMQPSMITSLFVPAGPPAPSLIPQLPQAGDELREALFNLKEGTVAVAPNRPRSIYYTLALAKREPATFSVLYAPTSDEIRYRNEAMRKALTRQNEAWMNELRKEAGIKPDWVPPDEVKKQFDSE